MRHWRLSTVGVLVTTVVVLVLAALPATAGAGSGMLKAGDVDLKVLSKPHSSTIIAIDTVTDGCQPGEQTERDGRVVSFAQNTAKPTSGAQLNQVVYDFGSAGAAKSFFADMRKNEERRVQCGKTAKAGGFKLSKGPGGVGDARFTVTSNEKVAGVTRKVVSIPIRAGSSVTELIFLDWDPSLPSTTAVAKKAADRLA